MISGRFQVQEVSFLSVCNMFLYWMHFILECYLHSHSSTRIHSARVYWMSWRLSYLQGHICFIVRIELTLWTVIQNLYSMRCIWTHLKINIHLSERVCLELSHLRYSLYSISVCSSAPQGLVSKWCQSILVWIVADRTFNVDAEPGPFVHLCCGTFSGAFGATCVYPLQLIRTRYMVELNLNANEVCTCKPFKLSRNDKTDKKYIKTNNLGVQIASTIFQVKWKVHRYGGCFSTHLSKGRLARLLQGMVAEHAESGAIC